MTSLILKILYNINISFENANNKKYIFFWTDIKK